MMASVPAMGRIKIHGDTLGWLAHTFGRKDHAGVARAFLGAAHDLSIGDHAVVKPGIAPRVTRTDVMEDEGIDYVRYSSPLLGSKFEVLRARFQPRSGPRPNLLSHAGEEYLLTLSGSVQYQVLSSPPGKEAADLPRPVERGACIRLASQYPHHTYAVGKHPADAWMIFRDIGGNNSALAIAPRRPGREVIVRPRNFRSDVFQDPGRFALIAWGIAERLELERRRAGLTVGQLAAISGVNASYVSRIESGQVDPTIKVITELARALNLRLLDLLPAEEEPFEVRPLPPAHGRRGPRRQPVFPGTRARDHALHLLYWELPKGTCPAPPPVSHPDYQSCWILLDGTALFRFLQEGVAIREFVDPGSVIHFRGAINPLVIEVLEEVRLLEVVYCEHECCCAKS